MRWSCLAGWGVAAWGIRDKRRANRISRGVVLDYEFRPRAEREFEALRAPGAVGFRNAAWTRYLSLLRLHRPEWSSFRSLACEVEPFNMWTPGIAEPHDIQGHGLYVDPIYF